MEIVYAKIARDHLHSIKKYIATDNKQVAIDHLNKIKSKIEILKDFPYAGKINPNFNDPNIRDFVVLGYKTIYKIDKNRVEILAIYKYLNFNESGLEL